MSTGLLVCAPLHVEAWALRRDLGSRTVRRTGYGVRRSARSAVRLLHHPGHALAVAGVAGGIDPAVRSGDVVVADDLLGADGTVVRTCRSARLVEELRRRGLTVHCGPIVTADRLVRGAERPEWSRTEAIAVDMESAVLAGAAGDRAFAVVRVAVDTVCEPLLNPGTPRRGWAALRQLRRTAGPLARWASSVAPPDEEIHSTRTREVS
ncbi:4-hydroxy-3-methylbut-2-enyl diphosphate reductase [Saccharopolyspora lacisalsi]|uniref:4-hydroxy-3-methylbut-2-enyl diphosphate reductase n=1 Tax=Halosaccharopolyspora lacisalsi TaxID=1000566 RepID=A0A839DUW2_9PSEU|nr:hypothetical protein [Halosaccharopolyspora lacisalsi]MBA8824549.1 4-hydroxy-3-methylbut-2-enyl diphosphate reductase [Halosaccharopolyspora lacisalsi]